jgi:hypothetical protein
MLNTMGLFRSLRVHLANGSSPGHANASSQEVLSVCFTSPVLGAFHPSEMAPVLLGKAQYSTACGIVHSKGAETLAP